MSPWSPSRRRQPTVGDPKAAIIHATLALESLLPKSSYSARETWFERFAGGFYSTVKYLFTIESHAYAMAIGASVLFGFYPFMVLILSLSQNVFQWSGAVDAIYVGLRDLLPNDPGLVDFVERNLRVTVGTRGHAEALSFVLLIFSANGIFMPLEVALNRLWGFRTNRSYWLNQIVSFSMTFICGVLALTAAVLTSRNVAVLQDLLGRLPVVPDRLTLIALKLAAIPFSIVIFLLVYWKLPNGKVSFRAVWPIAVLAGVVVEAAKNLYVWLWPMLDLRRAYGPFFISVTLLLWGFVAALLVLGGGEMCARRGRRLTELAAERDAIRAKQEEERARQEGQKEAESKAKQQPADSPSNETADQPGNGSAEQP